MPTPDKRLTAAEQALDHLISLARLGEASSAVARAYLLGREHWRNSLADGEAELADLCAPPGSPT